VKPFAIGLAFVAAGFADLAQAQSFPKVRAAYTSIGIQFDPIYIMKDTASIDRTTRSET
jgi:hypothetical protein